MKHYLLSTRSGRDRVVVSETCAGNDEANIKTLSRLSTPLAYWSGLLKRHAKRSTMLSSATMNNLSPPQRSFSSHLKPSIPICKLVKVQPVGPRSNVSFNRFIDSNIISRGTLVFEWYKSTNRSKVNGVCWSAKLNDPSTGFIAMNTIAICCRLGRQHIIIIYKFY